MDNKIYDRARRAGQKACSMALQRNEDPYLPVLEEKVKKLAQLSHISLGVYAIPVSAVTGSVSKGRSYAFARNFMPILGAETEFANKWCALAESVAEEGVREAVKVLEYMGEYYTQEGNKRVSVCRYLKTDYIEADVIRVMPEKNGSPEVDAYYEYCEFSRYSSVYDLVFSKPGGYKRILAMPGVAADKVWTDDETTDMKACYRYFCMAHEEVLKDERSMKKADAFLHYLTTFGYTTVKQDDLAKTRERIRLMREEFEIRDEPMQLIMDQEQTAGPSIIASFFRPQKIKAAFLYNRSTEESAWNYWHDLGRMEAEAKMGGRLETINCIIPSRNDFAGEIERLIHEGYTAFFATTPVMLNSCLQPALEHPDVRVLCCSTLPGAQRVRTYYLRFYEVKFLLGFAAGILARNGKIGYIGDFPIFGAASSANAFAMGARMVNPEAKVYLNWFSRKDFDERHPFLDPEIKVISNRDILSGQKGSREVGLYLKDEDRIINIGSLIPRWGVFYHTVLEQILNGTYDSAADQESANNYWLGMSSDALEVVFSNRLDMHTRRLISHIQDSLHDYDFNPFAGELRDQNNVLRCTEDRFLTPAEILCMDYLLDNIVSTIPEPEELIDSAQALVRLQGYQGQQKPDVSAIGWTN